LLAPDGSARVRDDFNLISSGTSFDATLHPLYRQCVINEFTTDPPYVLSTMWIHSRRLNLVAFGPCPISLDVLPSLAQMVDVGLFEVLDITRAFLKNVDQKIQIAIIEHLIRAAAEAEAKRSIQWRLYRPRQAKAAQQPAEPLTPQSRVFRFQRLIISQEQAVFLSVACVDDAQRRRIFCNRLVEVVVVF
jgi:hypothetical protein